MAMPIHWMRLTLFPRVMFHTQVFKACTDWLCMPEHVAIYDPTGMFDLTYWFYFKVRFVAQCHCTPLHLSTLESELTMNWMAALPTQQNSGASVWGWENRNLRCVKNENFSFWKFRKLGWPFMCQPWHGVLMSLCSYLPCHRQSPTQPRADSLCPSPLTTILCSWKGHTSL